MTMRAISLAFAAALAGCAVGPDFKAPEAPAAAGYAKEPLPPRTVAAPVAAGEAQHFKSGQDIAADWWRLFHSEPLNTLVEQAIKANPSVPAAQAALRQALENVAAQRGTYYPQVQADLTASRNLTAVSSLSPAGPTNSPYYSLITPQLSVSYIPDIFGANRRAVESLQAQADSQRFALEATLLTLTSNVVAGAIQEASLRGQIGALEQAVRIETNLLGILRKQQSLGQAAGADVAAQEAALAAAQLAVAPLQKQLDIQRDALTALAGRLPSQGVEQTFEISNLALPVDLPVSLPADLVRQRPDVRQAEETLHAASAQIGQAIAARLPQITLSANVGNAASTASNLFTPGTNFWTISAGVTEPLFDGFTLLHKQRAAQAAFDQAAAQYRGTVISAFQNVADSLRALHTDALALQAASASEKAASRSLSIVRNQLSLGQVSYLALLNAEATYLQAKLSLVQAQAARLTDTAALFQALGGGWWNRTGPAATETAMAPADGQ